MKLKIVSKIQIRLLLERQLFEIQSISNLERVEYCLYNSNVRRMRYDQEFKQYASYLQVLMFKNFFSAIFQYFLNKIICHLFISIFSNSIVASSGERKNHINRARKVSIDFSCNLPISKQISLADELRPILTHTEVLVKNKNKRSYATYSIKRKTLPLNRIHICIVFLNLIENSSAFLDSTDVFFIIVSLLTNFSDFICARLEIKDF